MILGMILDVGNASGGPGNMTYNGTAMLHFYTLNDAVNWALSTSELMVTGDAPIRVMTCVWNGETNTKRWWYNGVEYTG